VSGALRWSRSTKLWGTTRQITEVWSKCETYRIDDDDERPTAVSLDEWQPFAVYRMTGNHGECVRVGRAKSIAAAKAVAQQDHVARCGGSNETEGK